MIIAFRSQQKRRPNAVRSFWKWRLALGPNPLADPHRVNPFVAPDGQKDGHLGECEKGEGRTTGRGVGGWRERRTRGWNEGRTSRQMKRGKDGRTEERRDVGGWWERRTRGWNQSHSMTIDDSTSTISHFFFYSKRKLGQPYDRFLFNRFLFDRLTL